MEQGESASRERAEGKTVSLSRDEGSRIARQQRLERRAALGACVAMLAKAPGSRDMKIADIKWLVLPAITAGQYRLYEMPPSEKRPGGISGIVLNARVSPHVAARLDQMRAHRGRLEPQEWTSGDIVRTILVLGTEAAKPAHRPGALECHTMRHSSSTSLAAANVT